MDSPQNRFAALLAQHRGIVFKVAATYCRHPEDRQDLAQEIAAQLWRAFCGYDPARLFSTWMYRIALNVAISHVRSTSGSAQHQVDQQLRTFYAVIDRQSPMDRALLLLWLEDRSQREIAEVIGISESNVATKLNRLKQRIRQQLADPAFD